MTRNDFAVFFHKDSVLEYGEKGKFILPLHDCFSENAFPLKEEECFLLGEHQGASLFAVSLPGLTTKEHQRLVPARDALSISDVKTAQLICRGKQLLYWHKSTLYSGCCGFPTKLSKIETAKICQKCERTIYPTTFPVIIVLIEKGRHILLARSPHFAQGMFSTLAGFIDPGESCEAAIHREVEEEVGIRIKNISYFGSQAWPFPSSLMIGFKAEYAKGAIRFDGNEIEDARWFDIHSLPPLPHPCSIARHMIDSHVELLKRES